jgi:hypothetical protein
VLVQGLGYPLQAAHADRAHPRSGAFQATQGWSHRTYGHSGRKFQVNEQFNMTAASFLADFSHRIGCTTNFMHSREFDQDGHPQAIGSGCAVCPGCESKSGYMGLAESGYQVSRDDVQFTLAWACPTCAVKVSEDTTPLTCIADAQTILADPICHSCRKLSINTI